MALGTQWVVSGMGQCVGINYMAVEPTARLCGLPEVSPDAFSALRLMERAVLCVRSGIKDRHEIYKAMGFDFG